MKIKYGVSLLPANYRGTFFEKMLCMGEQTFLGKFIGGCVFYTGTDHQIVHGGKLMVKRFQMLSQFSFPVIDLGLGY